MIRPTLTFVLILSIAGCASRGVLPSTKGSAPGEPSVQGRRQTIAVYPFQNNAVTGRERLEFLCDWLPDLLGESLRQTGELRLVERRELLRLLEEQKLGASALASAEGRIRLGRIAGAQTLLFGGFTALGESLQIDVRIVDAQSGVVLKSLTSRGRPGDARDLGEQLARRLGEQLGIEIHREMVSAGLSESSALRAVEHFYAALSLEKEGRKAAAVEEYRRVLEIDRSDTEARRRLEALLLDLP